MDKGQIDNARLAGCVLVFVVCIPWLIGVLWLIGTGVRIVSAGQGG